MAIAFDTFSGGGVFNSAHTSHTMAHTTSGSDRILVVDVSGAFTSGGADAVASMQYNGVALTRVSTLAVQSNTFHAVYALINPTVGNNNLVITFDRSLAYSWISVASYTGVSQVGFPDATGTDYTSNGANITTQNNSVTSVADNSWAVMGCYAEGGQSAGAGTTLRGVGLVRSTILDSGGVISPSGSKTLTQNQDNNPGANVIFTMAPVAVASQNSNFLALMM